MRQKQKSSRDLKSHTPVGEGQYVALCGRRASAVRTLFSANWPTCVECSKIKNEQGLKALREKLNG